MKKIEVIILLVVFALLGISFITAQRDFRFDFEKCNDLKKEETLKVIINLDNKTITHRTLFFNQKTYTALEEKQRVMDKIGQKNIKQKYKTINAFSAELTCEEIKELEKEEIVKNIEPVMQFKLWLQDAVPLMNVNSSWNLQVGGINLTGGEQTVCIVDSGINFSHPDLLGRNATCNRDCVDKNCVGNCSLGDVDGHGTHVAGIVGASGSLIGIATNVSMISMNVFPESGSASGDDIIAAIDWCVDNCETYNISVISMSLGTDSLYEDYCDEFTGFNNSINAANNKNISVVVATGNSDLQKGISVNYTAISSPACIPNAIRVSSTDKDDTMASYAHRNNLTYLVATGTSINSSRWSPTGDIIGCDESGDYMSCSGTSMATPMVAGIIAITNQMLRLTGQSKTPQEIETVLNNTGEQIDDSLGSGKNFSRVNAHSGLLNLDNIKPFVELNSPGNYDVNLSVNQTFSCNCTDWQLANVTFYLWNSTDLIYNKTKNVSGVLNSSVFNVTNLDQGIYEWTCFSSDLKENYNDSVYNYTLIIGGISSRLDSPTDLSYTNQNETNFICTSLADDDNELTNVTFYLWNSTDLIYNKTKNVSGVLNSSVFNYTLINEINYSWNCLSVNNISNSSFANENSTIFFDVTSPNITLVTPVDGYGTTSISLDFVFNVSDNFGVGFCTLMINGTEESLTGNQSEISEINTIQKTSLSVGDYVWFVNCTDKADNNATSPNRSFSVSSVPHLNPSGSPSGGSSSGTVLVEDEDYTVTINETSQISGYSKDLNKEDKIVFEIFSGMGVEEHSLILDAVEETYADITIYSEPIKLRLNVGKSTKLSLSSKEYYDLYIKLENITDGLANITIKAIYELIEPIESIVEAPNNTNIPEDVCVEEPNNNWIIYIIEIILVIILFFIIKINSSRGVEVDVSKQTKRVEKKK